MKPQTLDQNHNPSTAQPNDSPAMLAALRTLDREGIRYERVTHRELKIGPLSFYPDRGYIYQAPDRLPMPKPNRGLNALVQIVRAGHQHAIVTPSHHDRQTDGELPLTGLIDWFTIAEGKPITSVQFALDREDRDHEQAETPLVEVWIP